MPELVEQVWEPTGPSYLRPRRDAKPFGYQAFVPDPIMSLDPVLTADTTGAVEAAAVAASQLDSSPVIQDLEPIAAVLLRAESVASSRIEGLRLSHRRLEEAIVAPAIARRTALSILQNIRAMARAIEVGIRPGPLTVEDLLGIHQEVLDTQWDRAHAGQLREGQNWIGGGNTPRRAEFVPPPADRVPALMADLASFCNRTDLSTITQAAVAHAQFETIHPFADGNGRAGRCLVHVILRRRGLSMRVVPPISVVLAANATRYVEGLTAYRAGDLGRWWRVFSDATATASERAAELAGALANLREAWIERAGRPRRNSAARRLIEKLVSHPILSVASASALLGVSDEASRVALNALGQAGVVQQITLGRRNRAWAAEEVFDLLDEFDMTIGTLREDGTRRPAPTRHLRRAREA